MLSSVFLVINESFNLFAWREQMKWHLRMALEWWLTFKEQMRVVRCWYETWHEKHCVEFSRLYILSGRDQRMLKIISWTSSLLWVCVKCVGSDLVLKFYQKASIWSEAKKEAFLSFQGSTFLSRERERENSSGIPCNHPSTCKRDEWHSLAIITSSFERRDLMQESTWNNK